MRAIEPGEPFEITYGKGRKLTLFALSKRGDIALGKLESEGQGIDSIEGVFEHGEKMLRLFLPDMPDAEFEKLTDGFNLPILKEVLAKATATTHLSEDDEKKSE